MSKTALITGITGQDGSHLADLLLSKSYKVFGLTRKLTPENAWRIEHIKKKIKFVQGDLMDQKSLDSVIKQTQPDELYNFGAQSNTPQSYKDPVGTAEINGVGVLRLLEALVKNDPKKTRFFQAGSAEMFGRVEQTPQNEETPFRPITPYAVAKVFAHWHVVNYRARHGMHAVNGILYPHEGPRRGLEFATRKITDTVARIAAGKTQFLELGNLEGTRDWTYAPDAVEAMWLTVQHEKPQDFVIASGQTHTVREFVNEAFAGIGVKDWEKKHFRKDPNFVPRPADQNPMVGDNSKIKKETGWRPKTSFKRMVREMLKADLERHGVGRKFVE
ncbi:MAG TPA: GDP-mannose 4,6-dehydratase [Candidatus Norongarragalinales archaeon]|jgi:GDPmannose 4,6-dehydratase|nr:GDP-mannose 4,6-dehydratase [Candidatus Norongarragalinales archaeon]